MTVIRIFLTLAMAIALTSGWPSGRTIPEAYGEALTQNGSDASPVFLNRVLDGLENRYLSSGFSAKFVQISTIKAMDISDTAEGNIWVKPPGQMRWEYESPDPQTIVTDGKSLWIYRPEDNQVMTGKAPTFFGDGKGAGFLSDIKQLREKFQITLEKSENPGAYHLKLVPQKNMLDLAVIDLFIEKNEFHVIRIITRNLYEDETRLDLKDIVFNPPLPEDLFTFRMPQGVDLLRIDE